MPREGFQGLGLQLDLPDSNTECPVSFEFQANDKCFFSFSMSHTMLGDLLGLKNISVHCFVQNSNLTGCPVFLFTTSDSLRDISQ